MNKLFVFFLSFFLVLMFSCGAKSTSHSKIGDYQLTDFPKIDFLWNPRDFNFKYGMPTPHSIIFKSKEGNYIQIVPFKDYSTWCEYVYLFEQIRLEWFHLCMKEQKEMYPELRGFSVDYSSFYKSHPNLFSDYKKGLDELQETLNAYLLTTDVNIRNKKLLTT